MAILKDTPAKGRRGAKAHIRYIQHRLGKDGEKITRELFGFDGAMTRKQAYGMVDAAPKGSWFYRFVLSPDPKREDTHKDLHLRDIVIQTALKLEEKLGKQVQFVGAIHNDHTGIRHVHFLAIVPKRIPARIFKDMRIAATEKALFQRRERDLALGITQSHVQGQRMQENGKYKRPSMPLKKQRRAILKRSMGRPGLRNLHYKCHVCGQENCLLHKKNWLELKLHSD